MDLVYLFLVLTPFSGGSLFGPSFILLRGGNSFFQIIGPIIWLYGSQEEESVVGTS